MKLKIPPVVVFIFSLGMLFGISYLTKDWNFTFQYRVTLSRIFLFAGALSGILGVLAFRAKRTTVDPTKPEKASSIVTGGIYRYTRNPMYLGMALALVGGVLRTGNPFCILSVIFLVWYLTIFQIKPEEEALSKLFGTPYKDYQKRVRRWI